MDDIDIFERINHYIVEELSINDDVSSFTDKVIVDGQKILQNAHIRKDISGLSYKRCQFNEILVGNTITICLKMTYCSPDKYNDMIKQNPRLEDVYSLFDENNSRIVINFVNYQGELCNLWMISNSVQHEANHLYQQIKKGSRYETHKKDGIPNEIHKGDIMYRFAAIHLGSPNITLNSIATILYLSCKNEQDAFVNGLDGDLRYNSALLNDETYKNTDTYKRYKSLLNCINYCNENKNIVDAMLSDINEKCHLNITFDTLLKLAKTAEKRFGRKIASVIIKNKEKMKIEHCARWKGDTCGLYLI